MWLSSTAQQALPFEPVGERRCLVGRPTCGDADPCAAHRHWKKVANQMEDFFTTTTIGALLKGNPRASAEARELLRSIRQSNQRDAHGSVA
jgi:DNA-binding IscR family transcriptional regulator